MAFFVGEKHTGDKGVVQHVFFLILAVGTTWALITVIVGGHFVFFARTPGPQAHIHTSKIVAIDMPLKFVPKLDGDALSLHGSTCALRPPRQRAAHAHEAAGPNALECRYIPIRTMSTLQPLGTKVSR